MSRLTSPASAPFWGPKTLAASSNGVRTSQSTTSRAPPQAPGALDRPDRAGAAVGGGAAAHAEVDGPRAGVDGGGDELDRCRRWWRRTRRARARSTRPRPDAAAVSTMATSPARPNSAWIGRPSGSVTSACRRSAPRPAASASSVPSPPSATGHRSTGRPAPCSPRPMAAATSDALKVPLNESGATSTVSGHAGDAAHARAVSSRAPARTPGSRGRSSPGSRRSRATRPRPAPTTPRARRRSPRGR